MTKERPGFTLVELMISVLIFSFMMASLATVYSTSSRYMFQNYRTNIIKSNVGLSMKAIQNTLALATRIDLPAKKNAGTNSGDSGNTLEFATNVDGTSGCYPITAAAPAAWHCFCVAADPDPTNPVQDLYYHTGPINGGNGCTVNSPSSWNPNNSYPAFCGMGGGGSVMILMKNVKADDPTAPLFSRSALQGVTEKDAVHVLLHSYWLGPGQQHPVDFALETVVKASIPGQ